MSARAHTRDAALASAGAAAQRTQDYGDGAQERDAAVRAAQRAGWKAAELSAVTGLSCAQLTQIRQAVRS